MRNISFSHTKDQFLTCRKTVTRRLGWHNLKVGERLMAVEKGMGLKRGEKVKKLGIIVVSHVRRERLDLIVYADCIAEGFPDMSPLRFVEFFCRAFHCQPTDMVTRIEFRRIAS